MLTLAGEELTLGGKFMDGPGLDLLGAVTGSEGMLGVVTEVTVRILPKPQLAEALLIGFPTVAAAGNFVAAVIAAGIIPAGMEMMDKLAIEAAEAFCAPGYPMEAEALVIVELDGFPAEVRSLLTAVEGLAGEAGASSLKRSANEAERQIFWAGRKSAFPAVGRLAPDYLCMDGTIPRGKLAEVMEGMTALSKSHGLAVANVFHAGDGNLHPLVLYDASKPDGVARAEALGAEILRLCVSVGGVLTGEHGVGIEKRDLMDEVFSADDLKHQQRLKCAFDPDGLLNPGKVFPTLHRCVELGHMHVQGGKTRHGHLPRM
ncbi:MAG: FAD-linked oxidase C-terminal domain-containing protein, partial [Alphaproteobacteria bacterium]